MVAQSNLVRRTGVTGPWLAAGVAVVALVLGGCSPSPPPDPSARVIDLPGAGRNVDFDDVVYSSDLGRVLVPARDRGLYLIDPVSGEAARLPYQGNADSVDAGQSGLFVLDRSGPRIQVLDSAGQARSAVSTSAGPDYIRYVPGRGELWLSEPGQGGVEIFALGESLGDAPRRAGFVPVSGGVEGLTLTSDGSTAYVHAGNDVARIDVATRTVTARWPSGCAGTHGFPRVDEQDGFVLASCADNGKVALLDVRDGHRVGEYETGGGESLPAYSSGRGHFYVRSDPGTTVVTLEASSQGLKLIKEVQVPRAGHCLGAEDGYYWTCDADTGQVLLFNDP